MFVSICKARNKREKRVNPINSLYFIPFSSRDKKIDKLTYEKVFQKSSLFSHPLLEEAAGRRRENMTESSILE